MTDHYTSILASRYASAEMSAIFSPHSRYVTWRELWIALAKAQKQVGLTISLEQIEEMQAACHKIDFSKAAAYEKKFGHDVMAHIHAFADQCPKARSIIHLGATSCFVTDNADLILIRKALKLLEQKLVQAIRQLYAFAKKHAGLVCLSYTHFQAAQPTTVGKRTCLWLQDLVFDLEQCTSLVKELRFLGAKGATGTQASFLALLGSREKVKTLDRLVAKELGFDHLFAISSQTYPRKQDISIVAFLSQLAASAHKFATDLRLLAHLKEMEEPFSSTQVGSSAMPYKRNPMRSERICGLSRFLFSLNANPLYTAATQWLERSLDDSANRRLCLPEAFLCADAILDLLCFITSDLIIYPKIIEKHLEEEIPFLATEYILMQLAKQGKDRQKIHARLREHSLLASREIKEEGKDCDLLNKIAHDPEIGLSLKDLQKMTAAKQLTGCAEEQTHEFLQEIEPLLAKYKNLSSYSAKVEI
ncbi:MAG: adenylosuccinate lyase [Candidatus Rhabdochlamydia sp.]